MKIYTKTGDKGTTSLVYGERVLKTDPRVEAYGTCDEANSMIGLALSYFNNEDFEGKNEILEVFHQVQTSLFHVGAELSTPVGKEVKWKISTNDITELEQVLDKWDEKIPPLQNFILPGGHPSGAGLHVARTIVRRAERKAVAIGEDINPLVLSYLNRLSDFLFVAARYINFCLKTEELGLHQ
ncbi:ATP:cob(I)alamin adenosyltransferase [Schinkia azotoformans MEV2011]|uniref:Corrinoid adenosyltransferase n=1 Tax=Schinkia azotoformans MEV2011 TaxID=1348973 RepID=A0A072NQT2_SCHAZ|nr:cob(I)yrinic acid a,c-diamide adenosyltransferase [Schinkia azotoformans]KEF39258.1 ATP:cob(I)alamin adenosyltransferase [Schinkia azotoformans MEV2011]MEC1694988.1 cob(I)yrinic acid a,c-diamide adenosyltransferase [Schinkia azotoformans]MEC1716142.1 cob(I)yrinic acid a,c-diamide adenosyltransferase [Schinkia azotoformans]MEC1725599.1 cob(I)yrinic acid a,c-diamide adenosyltransferase [Schinkia azotoformans]MEC1739974.1 cob(I)yrinic acid a,c-diamide adenosyltransferase [Schinkia azotoformans